MKARNKRTVLFLTAASMAVLTLGVILPELSKSDFNLHDFISGLFSGMGSVTFVVWLIYLLKNIGKHYSADGLIILSKDKNILLALTMMLLLITAVAADYFTRNMFALAACIVIVSSSYILNFIYVKKAVRRVCEV